MERRSPVDGTYSGRSIVFAGNGRDGIPDRYRFNKRHPDSGVPEPDRHSRNRRTRDVVHGLGTTASLPTWYQYLAIVATLTAIIAFLVVRIS